jgi:6-phosphogluconolactonase/glucosamine-6-phosphate isomerase/deaminase
MVSNNVGGWNIDVNKGTLPEKVATGFSEVFNNIVGATYIPLVYVGSQVVNGVNHAIVAEQTIITDPHIKNIVLIVLNEKPIDEIKSSFTVVSIEPVITGNDLMGGIGVDGHIAFNEPYTSLTSRTGVRDLTSDTRIVNSRFFGNNPEAVPAQALSVGVGTVTDSKEVLILINGHNKARALAATVEGAVSSKWTCSALQMHNGAIIACDEPACGELTVDTYKYFLDIEKKEML